MKKKLLIILLAGLMTLSFTACGKNEVQSSDPQAAEETEAYTSDQTADIKEETDEEIEITETQDFAALLAPFYGTYRFDGNNNQAKDPNEIVIDENGVSYGGESLSILRVTMDNYVKFNDSDVMFIMNSDSISANFLHPEDQSVLEDYPVVIRSAQGVSPSNSDANPATEAPANKYVGTYGGRSGNMIITKNTIEFTADGKSYTTSFSESEIKDNDGIGELAFTVDGSQIVLYFGRSDEAVEIIEVYIDNKPYAFERGKEGDSAEPTEAKSSALEGNYTHPGHATLSVTADGSFTYTVNSNSNEATVTGKLPDKVTSGMTVQAGEYTLQMFFPEDYSVISISGKGVASADLSRD